MKKSLFPMLMALLVALPHSRAQTTYSNLYIGDGSRKMVALAEGKTLVTMGRGPALTKLDSVGELIWTKWKWGNGVQPIYYPLCVAKISESSFYCVGGYQSSGFQPVLCRLDTSGDILEAARYVIGNTLMSFAKDLTVTSDGGAVIWSEPWFSGFFILKAQQDLAHQWSHFYGANGSFQFVKELPGGDLLAGINMDTAGAAVARLDANGNMMWCKSYIRPRGVVHDAVVESDDSFLITGYTDSTGSVNPLDPLTPGYDPKLFLMKLNGAGEVQWCKGYEGAQLWYARNGQQTVQSLDIGYVLMANAASANNIANTAVLLKVNSNGDTLWTRTTNATGHQYRPFDLIGRDDGGYMMSLSITGSGVEEGEPGIFKTDPLGHFPCGDQSYPVQAIDLFPVDSAFTLIPSASGATAYPVTFRDTIFEPITTYDFCEMVTAVPDPMRRHQVHIHPNPSSGHFTMAFSDPLTVDSFYSVHDATGRLLFQRPLTKSLEKVEIDLSGYGKGMYLIRFSDRDGVCAERVVVE